MTILTELNYFGCIASFAGLPSVERLVLERHENFQKMGYRNRTQVLGAGKVIDLTVPLAGGRDQKKPYGLVEIDYSQHWQPQHWRTLESCYNKSAFFTYFAPELRQLLFADYTSLWQLNLACLQWVLKKLRWGGTLALTGAYHGQVVEEGCKDQRNQYRPANRTTWPMPPYTQVFGTQFEPNLSILDLLCSLGPQAGSYLSQLPVAEATHTGFGSH